jgi:large subunit ribosomal protein L6
MSRIGRKLIHLPTGVTVTVADAAVTVKGAKGTLSEPLPAGIEVTQTDGQISVANARTDRQSRANHGLVRAQINNMVHGVSEGFVIKLEMVGTGYRVAKKGAGLNLSIGFSHPVEIEAIPGIELGVEGNTIISVSGISKYLVGQTAANIRAIRPPEPYKGKGIRYQDEVIRRKQGKAAAK